MENKEFEELKEILKNGNGTSDSSWIWILLLLSFSMIGNTRVNEEMKMKEDIAELKGKMSMLEKML